MPAHTFVQAREVTNTYDIDYYCEFFDGKLFRVRLMTDSKDENVLASAVAKLKEADTFSPFEDSNYLRGLDNLKSNGTIITSVQAVGNYADITIIFKRTYDAYTKARSKAELTLDFDDLSSH